MKGRRATYDDPHEGEDDCELLNEAVYFVRTYPDRPRLARFIGMDMSNLGRIAMRLTNNPPVRSIDKILRFKRDLLATANLNRSSGNGKREADPSA